MNFQAFFDSLNPEATLSAAQRRYIAIVFDGADPNPNDALDVKLFGALPIPAEARAVIATLKGARVGGTWLHSLHLLYRALTAELNTLAKGEVGYCIIVAPDLRLARQALSYVLGAVDHPSIAKNVVAQTSESVTVKRKDGRKVCIECLPASRGGSATRGRSIVGALLDDASFFRDAETGVVNDSEVFRSITARVIPGGCTSVVSTAWGQSGLLQDLIETNRERKITALSCVAPTLTMRDDPEIRQMVAREQIRDNLNAQREYFCEALPAGSGGLFPVDQLQAALRNIQPVSATDGTDRNHIQIGVDLGFVKDSSAFVAVKQDPKTGVCTVLDALELKPGKGRPLSTEQVLRELACFCERFGQTRVYLDGFVYEQAKEIARMCKLRLTLVAVPQSNSAREQRFGFVVDLFRAGRVVIPRSLSQLTEELARFQSTPKSGGGHSITIPRTGGSHGDLASAFILAISNQASNDLARRAMANGHVLIDALNNVANGGGGAYTPNFGGGGSSFEAPTLRHEQSLNERLAVPPHVEVTHYVHPAPDREAAAGGTPGWFEPPDQKFG